MRASREIMGDLAMSGMTPEQIALVMELTAAISSEARPVVDEAAQRRRARDREYQAEKRRHNRPTSADIADNPTPSLSPHTPQSHPHPGNNKPTRVKGHRLPTDWQPAPLPTALATVASLWPPGSVERELSRFRDWAASATGSNAVKTDWDAAWRNWLRKAEDEGRYGRAPKQANDGAGGLVQSILAR